MAELDYMDLIAKKRDWIVIIVVIAVFSLFTRNIYDSQMRKYNKLIENIKTEEDKSSSLDRIILATEKIKKIKVKGWDTIDANQIIEKIYNIGLESSIKLRDITPSEKKDEKNYILIPFSLSCEAAYNDFLRFIKKLETYNKFLRIRNISISPIPALKRSEVPVKFSLTVDAVYFK